MQRTVLYKYLGTNGTLITPIHLENIYSVQLVRLMAENGKMLTDGKQLIKMVEIPIAEEANWREIDL